MDEYFLTRDSGLSEDAMRHIPIVPYGESLPDSLDVIKQFYNEVKNESIPEWRIIGGVAVGETYSRGMMVKQQLKIGEEISYEVEHSPEAQYKVQIARALGGFRMEQPSYAAAYGQLRENYRSDAPAEKASITIDGNTSVINIRGLQKLSNAASEAASTVCWALGIRGDEQTMQEERTALSTAEKIEFAPLLAPQDPLAALALEHAPDREQLTSQEVVTHYIESAYNPV